MTAAIIGLVGVVIGTLLSGVASDILQRRKQRAAALAAARAIATELRVAHAKLGSATKPARSP
jgi:xanthosine utilization system XapX-like protein